MDIEDMTYFGDVGMHMHALLVASGKTNNDGAHEHLFVVTEELETPMGRLYEGRILWTARDGAHGHDMAGNRTATSGAHSHAVSVRGLNVETSSSDGHSHELGVQSTGRDGVHSHTLEVGGMTLKSLTPSDFHAAMQEVMAKGDVPEPVIERAGGGYEVKSEGKVLSKHETREGAEKGVKFHHFLAKCGFHGDLSDTAELAKSVDLMVEKEAPKAVTGAGLLGKMDQLLKDVEGTGVNRF
jgi:hypothetical protein